MSKRHTAKRRKDNKASEYSELFFKWIKRHLRIKAFFGTSENAVKAQIWIAISVYVLVTIVRTLFEKTPILRHFKHTTPETIGSPPAIN